MRALLLLAAPLGFSESQPVLLPLDDKAVSAVREWSESLVSFRGEYSLLNEREDKEPRNYRVRHRSRGNDLYIEMRPAVPIQALELGFASLAGVNSRRTIDLAGVVSGTVNELTAYAVPPGLCPTPMEFFGRFEGKSLGEQLSNAHLKLFGENDGFRLTVRADSPGASWDVWLDSNLQVTRLDRVIWYRLKEDEKSLSFESDPVLLTIPELRFEYANWLEIERVRFPLLVTRRTFEPDIAAVNAAQAAHREGKLDRASYLLERTLFAKVIAKRTLTLSFVADEFELNPVLSDSEFVFSFPDDAEVGDAETGREMAKPWHRTPAAQWVRNNWAVLLGCASAFGIAVYFMARILVRRAQ